MDEFDCSDLEALGLWSTSRCCAGCHRGDDCEDDDDLVFEFVDPRRQCSIRLTLCCASADTLIFDDRTLEALGALKAS